MNISDEIRNKLAGMLRDGGATVSKIAEALGMTMDEVRIAKRGGITGAPMDAMQALILQADHAVRKGRVEETEAVEEILSRIGIEPEPALPITKVRFNAINLTGDAEMIAKSLETSQQELDPTAIADSRNALETELRAILDEGEYSQDMQGTSMEERLLAMLPSSPPGSKLRQICENLGVPWKWLAEQHGYQPDVDEVPGTGTTVEIAETERETAEQAAARAAAERAARETMQAQQALAAALQRAEDAGVSVSADTQKMNKAVARKQRGLVASAAKRAANRMADAIDTLAESAARTQRRLDAEDQAKRDEVARITAYQTAKRQKEAAGRDRFAKNMARADALRDYIAKGGRHAEQHLEICKAAAERYPEVFNCGHFDVDRMSALQAQCYTAVQSGKPLAPEAFAKVQQLRGKIE